MAGFALIIHYFAFHILSSRMDLVSTVSESESSLEFEDIFNVDYFRQRKAKGGAQFDILGTTTILSVMMERLERFETKWTV